MVGYIYPTGHSNSHPHPSHQQPQPPQPLPQHIPIGAGIGVGVGPSLDPQGHHQPQPPVGTAKVPAAPGPVGNNMSVGASGNKPQRWASPTDSPAEV
jgi:hypothetical protein